MHFSISDPSEGLDFFLFYLYYFCHYYQCSHFLQQMCPLTSTRISISRLDNPPASFFYLFPTQSSPQSSSFTDHSREISMIPHAAHSSMVVVEVAQLADRWSRISVVNAALMCWSAANHRCKWQWEIIIIVKCPWYIYLSSITRVIMAAHVSPHSQPNRTADTYELRGMSFHKYPMVQQDSFSLRN